MTDSNFLASMFTAKRELAERDLAQVLSIDRTLKGLDLDWEKRWEHRDLKIEDCERQAEETSAALQAANAAYEHALTLPYAKAKEIAGNAFMKVRACIKANAEGLDYRTGLREQMYQTCDALLAIIENDNRGLPY